MPWVSPGLLLCIKSAELGVNTSMQRTGEQSPLLLPQTQSTSHSSKASKLSQTGQPHHSDWVRIPLSKPSDCMVWNYLLAPKHKAAVKEA